ncbi:hypothetical protein ILUMI_07462 [Ignelater luminosus]|uniref:Carboxylesterase type B domain-containing protein n=1 Tax=Ignelater luminosus TaxID=2038154 RepID=A0A8K0D9C2_IGNLU|nr:hypothetical protein ILUMI_07462 [Ignelater luminosus]
MSQDPIVNTEEGRLCGRICYDYTGGQYFSFQGIPYARPPIGKLRFKAPQPPEPWTGIRDATTEGNVCYHRSEFKHRGHIGSDDCLFLNVYTPELPIKNGTELKPVMFWIHGGAYQYGSGNTDMYGPDYLISEDVVIVTINYRFGLLGFLSLEDASLGVPGNAGLKDQVMALKWVQRNIKQFCGDPNNVTIFGQSCGGASVHYLTLSPMTKGLFHRAIIQSGVGMQYWTKGQPAASAIAKALKLNDVNEREILRILQNMSVEELFKVQEKLPLALVAFKKRVIGFVIEKQTNEPAFLSEDPVNLIKSGRYHHVPLIIGYTSREGIYYAIYTRDKYGTVKVSNNLKPNIPHTLKFQVGSELCKAIAAKMKDFYYGEEEPENEKNIDNIYLMHTDVNFHNAMWNSIKHLSLTSSAPVYFYIMSLNSKLNIYKNIGKIHHSGACHGDDLGYLFKTNLTPKDLGIIEKEGIKRFTTLWTNFAKTGDPNPKRKDSLINVTWEPIEKDKLNYLNIGENLTVGVNPDARRMQFWDEIYALSDTNAKL